MAAPAQQEAGDALHVTLQLADAALAAGFQTLGLDEIVSFTALDNRRSRAVMERIGLHDTGRDFDHPAVPEGSPLRRHCLYAITRGRWVAGGGAAADAIRTHLGKADGLWAVAHVAPESSS